MIKRALVNVSWVKCEENLLYKALLLTRDNLLKFQLFYHKIQLLDQHRKGHNMWTPPQLREQKGKASGTSR